MSFHISGSNDRNRGYTTWLVLDEHCCIVLIPPLWIRLGTPYLMPAQVAYCSGLELQRRVELLGSPAEESKAKSSSSTMNKVDLTSDEYDGGNIISDMQMSNSLITVSNDSAASYGYEGLSVDNNRSRQTHKEDNISTECNITIDGLSDFASEADRRFGRVEDCAVNNKNRFDSTVSEIDSIGSCCGTFSCCLKCNSIMDTNNVSTTSNCSSYRYCICCRNIDRKSVISFIDSTRDSNEEKAPSVDDIDREDQLAPNSNSSGTAASSSDNEDCVLIVPELSDSISILINRMTLCKFLLPTEKYSWLPTGLLDYAINSADISSGIIKIGAVGVSRSALAKRGTQLLEAGSTWLQNPENYAVRSFKYSQERRSLPKVA